MSADDPFAPHGAFAATDWLAQGSASDFDASAAGSYDEADPLAFLAGNPFGGYDSHGDGTGKGMLAPLTQDELARALMGGFDTGGGLSSIGTSTAGARSDAGSSPFSSGISHAGSVAVPPSSSGAFDFDAVLANSPPFSIPPNLACDFDTSALQDLFTNSTPSSTAGSAAHLSPYPQAHAPFQTVSPASSVSPYAAPLGAFPQQRYDNFSTFDPAQLFAPTSTSSSGSSPSAPHLSVDFASPTSFASLSPPVTAPAPVPQAYQQPTYTSLAATAGISVPALHAVPNSRAGPHGFSLNQDPATVAVLNAGARGRTTRNRAQVSPPAASAMPTEAKTAVASVRSPMEVIANAGLQNGVHPAPLLQLRPHVNFSQPAPATSRSSSHEGAGAENVETAQDEQKAADKVGKKGKKADRGHNAVEQKYRNSINNALATLRDTIPALRHLKPLPSMPVSKRKASQFTLASAAVPETPTGLVDGVAAAKTLSKGVILTKAIEYIDFLRFTRESRDADIELLKGMVRDMVGGGDALVEEFERRRAVLETGRAEERERVRLEDEEDGTGDEEDEEEDAPVPAPAAKEPKAAAAGTKRGRKGDAPAATAKKARGAASTSATGLSPSLTGDYRHVQARNQAHLDSLSSAPQYQHVLPPSPISSGDELSGSPGTVANNGAGGRVLLASFMGVSFAGGLGYDLAGSAVVAEESFGAAAARVLTGRIARRSGTVTDIPSDSALVAHIHPAFVSGLLAVGAATVVVALIYLVLPFFSRRSAPPISPCARRRSQAIAALSALSVTSAADSTFSATRASALAARRELLRLVDAPGPFVLFFALAKEASCWAARRVTGLTWTLDGAGTSQEDVEEAVAWVRVAEIETMLGDRLSYLTRLHTFLRLSNLSRSPSWPQVSPSTSRAGVDALLAVHLLSLGYPRWAEAQWQRMLARRKKTDSAEGDSFVELALASEWESVRSLLAPESRLAKAADDVATSSDTVPLLLVAETACEDAMKDAWSSVFVGVAETTTSTPSAEAAAESLAGLADADETATVVGRAMPEGSDLHTLALVTKVFLACYRVGTSSTPSTSDDTVEARTLLAQLVLGSKESLARLACAAPLLQLLAPALSGPVGAALASFIPSPAEHPASDIDLLATVTFTWLLVRRQGDHVAKEGGDDAEAGAKPNPELHAQALALRRLLGSDLFQAPGPTEDAESDVEDYARFEEAKELLVDALTGVARRAAGLSGGFDEDSGVELEA